MFVQCREVEFYQETVEGVGTFFWDVAAMDGVSFEHRKCVPEKNVPTPSTWTHHGVSANNSIRLNVTPSLFTLTLMVSPGTNFPSKIACAKGFSICC